MKRTIYKMISLIIGIMVLMTGNSLIFASSDTFVSHYDDIYMDDWYREAVNETEFRGLMKGVGFDEFRPNENLTREAFVAIMRRIDVGDDSIPFAVDKTEKYETKFSDVVPTAWYAMHISWAEEKGITYGITDDKFGVGQSITREEASTLIKRYLDVSGIKLKDAKDPAGSFKDADEVSDWAQESLEFMRLSGVLQGDEKGYFHPKSYITRAEAAAMIIRLDDALIFDVESLLDFDKVSKIRFVKYGSDADRREYEITEKSEIESIVEYFRDATIIRTEATAMTSGGTYAISFYDKDGNKLNDFRFSKAAEFISVNGVRNYYFEEGFLQGLIDKFES